MKVDFKPIGIEKEMANGHRNLSPLPLTTDEVKIVIEAGKSIGIDPDIFIFNDEEHLTNVNRGTGYNSRLDKIFITRNVFPDETSYSSHPRDRLSVRAVLAHEYYGHRPFRDEYLRDNKMGTITTSEWEDECRASINAAINTLNLTDMERSLLLDDAIFRAREYGQELDPKSESNVELRRLYDNLYGYPSDEKYIVPVASKITPAYLEIRETISLSQASEKVVRSIKEEVEALKMDVNRGIEDDRERIGASFEIKERRMKESSHEFEGISL